MVKSLNWTHQTVMNSPSKILTQVRTPTSTHLLMASSSRWMWTLRATACSFWSHLTNGAGVIWKTWRSSSRWGQHLSICPSLWREGEKRFYPITSGKGQMYHGPHQCCGTLAEVPWSSGQHLQQHADRCSQQWERCRQQDQELHDRRLRRSPRCGSPLQGAGRHFRSETALMSVY